MKTRLLQKQTFVFDYAHFALSVDLRGKGNHDDAFASNYGKNGSASFFSPSLFSEVTLARRCSVNLNFGESLLYA